MVRLTPAQYDSLERAISEGRRIAVTRRGNELVLLPIRLRPEGRVERIEGVHPTTGEVVSISLDEVETLEVL